MLGQFGSREICNVTFKSLVSQTIGTKTFAAGQPVFVIDTATTSSMEQATTTVYAQGGRGYNRLIAWEGEKQVTFNVTDALMSPIGLKVLSGAGFAADNTVKHIHVTYDAQANVGADNNATGKVSHSILAAELGIPATQTIKICADEAIKAYATILDANGSIVDWADAIDFSGPTKSDNAYPLVPGADINFKVPLSGAVNKYSNGDTITVKLDFYVIMTSEASQITIKPGDFGGNFYVEADTLYRNRFGKDMAATMTFPNVKVQSGFTITMAANGDPSTFDFVMDALPGYTYFDKTNKVICDITIVSGDTNASTNVTHAIDHTAVNAAG